MDYRRFDDTIVARIDKGEEILEQIKVIAEQEKVRLASVEALGAISEFKVGVFHPKTKEYSANELKGEFEIVSLIGTISTMDGAFYSHIHMSAGDANAKVFGGHLNRAVVSATCEMVIRVINGSVDRRFDEEIGLNLFKF